MSNAGEPATRDRATGLDSAQSRITEWMATEGIEEGSTHLHAMLVGLRRFDAVNLAYGEAAGDEALEEVATRMNNFAAGELEGRWLVARAGGGSFLLLAAEPCSRERWQLVADELAEVVSRPIALPSGVLRLSPRVALIRMLTSETIELMLDRLGQSLSQATLKQGARFVWANGEATPPGRSSAQLEADLLAAIERDEIEVLYQPQFSLTDDRLVGAEALARWNHPELGRIGASALFAIAERTDHITPLSQHIARKALNQAGHWPANLRLSLNVTAADLAFGSYAGQLLDTLRATAFPPNRLTLEVTEQALITDIGLAAQIMAEFVANGIRMALDDFGAGFCNFRYLKLLPLHYLKLDRSMVDGIGRDRRDRAVLRAIVAMAKALDLEVIAEGIESEAQRARVAAEGCAYYQGFIRAQPMSAEMFAKLVAVSA
ncbi:EAL domain-containing protein (putative c-di-GMP-specific phosphodiesterase class I)/GGDEF domain-containing protein [Novosphingobium fluoreni]|uniref:EAL domain-containing protein (Putative c-di-GMP-specific phosphodiesterase class I)/GGDEF domain-containing protein n=1 Tax=Novosphingobium fluoreni TaxID=1391222 RepID=A0A7W6BXZ1_9SPHN|nr:GGDEF domain-containing phosphodiesterase [Novosphingobium fluoreni]MBB3939998.1 EAL domain-containing protein (putative c-di-GMP-specific phosphodiesterase class I)/GGDEF domain-containing protein [Novosphingobium fluoreni]